MNIRQKLLMAFMALSILPLLMVGSLYFYNSKAALQSDRIAALESIADLKVEMITTFMNNLRIDAFIAQDYLNIKNNLPQLISLAHNRKSPEYLQAKKDLDSQLKTLQRLKGFEDIMLTTADGTVVYVSNQAHEAIDMDSPLLDEKAIEEGKQGIYLGDIIDVTERHASLKSKHSNFEMVVSAPLFDSDGSLIGLLVFEIDMQPVYTLIQKTTGLGDSGETLIGQNRGDHALFLNTLRHDPSAAMRRTAKFGAESAYPIQQAVQGHRGAGMSIDYRGVKIIAAWRHIPELNWGVVAKIDAAEAFQSTAELRNYALMLGFLVLLLIVVCARAMSASFSKPIHSLMDGIRFVGMGNLDHKVGTGGADEIGELSRAFDEMVLSLRRTTSSRDVLEKEMAERREIEEMLLATDGRLKQHHDAYAVLSQNEDLRCGKLTPALQEITAATSRALEAERVSIWLFDESGDVIRSLDLFEFKKEQHSQGLELAIRDYPGYFKALRDDDIIVANDAHTDPRTHEFSEHYLAPLGITSMLDAPVHVEGENVGVLCIEHIGPCREWAKDEQQFARSVAELVALAMHANKRQLAKEEINKKNEELENANQLKSEFLANMSHELRTPLNAIIGFSELMKDGAIGDLNDDQGEYMQEIFSSGHHLLELINEILDLSKIEAGKMSLDLSEVIISDILKNSLSIISEKAMANAVSLQTDISEDIGCCMVDMRKLKQILYNLLSNAVKFTPNGGGVALKAQLVRGDIDALKDCAPMQQFLEIRVTDTGIGIAEEDHEKIFRPFEQVDGSMSRHYEGTGLGLILVKSMVELHGGTVAVESELDKGSTFTVWLPYKPSELEQELAHAIQQEQ